MRIKIGVGEKPKGWDLIDYVLGRFEENDRKLVDEAVDVAVEAATIIMTEGIDEAMNRCNRTGKQE